MAAANHLQDRRAALREWIRPLAREPGRRRATRTRPAGRLLTPNLDLLSIRTCPH